MKNFFLCIFIFIFSIFANAQAKRNMGFSSCIIQTADEGFALTGKTYTSDASGEDIYVVKLDGRGNIKWTKTVGGSYDQFGNSIIQTKNGGYAITGATTSSGPTGEDVYIVSLDAVGNIKCSQTVGGFNDEVGYFVNQMADGSFLITGATTPLGEEEENVYVVKIDSACKVKWKKTIPGLKYSHGSSIIHTKDGGYAIGGYKEAPPTEHQKVDHFDFSIVKLDSVGNVQWNKIIGGAGSKSPYSMVQTKDGGYAVTGTIDSASVDKNVYVVKLDASGNSQWAKTIGGKNDDIGSAIVQTEDGGYAITGSSKSSGAGGFDVYAIKLTATGNIIWVKTIGGNGDDKGESIVQTSDGGYAIGGSTNEYRTVEYKFYAVKLDADGNLQWEKAIGNDGH